MNSSERAFRVATWAKRAAEADPAQSLFSAGTWVQVVPPAYRVWQPGSLEAGLAAGQSAAMFDLQGAAMAADGPGTRAHGPAGEDALDPASPSAAGFAPVSDPQALEAARQAGYEAGHTAGLAVGREAGREAGHQAGLAAGRAEALAEMQDDRVRLRRVVAATDDAVQRPEVLFEPLKRLALHIARELVRCELSLSAHAVDHLIRGCLAALDEPAERIIVSLNPDDFRLITADPSLGGGLTFESDDSLSAGSVRVRADETRVLDFIEHRLRALADTLLSDGQPGPSR